MSTSTNAVDPLRRSQRQKTSNFDVRKLFSVRRQLSPSVLQRDSVDGLQNGPTPAKRKKRSKKNCIDNRNSILTEFRRSESKYPLETEAVMCNHRKVRKSRNKCTTEAGMLEEQNLCGISAPNDLHGVINVLGPSTQDYDEIIERTSATGENNDCDSPNIATVVVTSYKTESDEILADMPCIDAEMDTCMALTYELHLSNSTLGDNDNVDVALLGLALSHNSTEDSKEDALFKTNSTLEAESPVKNDDMKSSDGLEEWKLDLHKEMHISDSEIGQINLKNSGDTIAYDKSESVESKIDLSGEVGRKEVDDYKSVGTTENISYDGEHVLQITPTDNGSAEEDSNTKGLIMHLHENVTDKKGDETKIGHAVYNASTPVTDCSGTLGKRERKAPVRHGDYIPDQEIIRSPTKRCYGIPNESGCPVEAELFSCAKCPASFPSRTGLANHRKQHGSDNKFECDQCDFSCKNMKTLRFHEEVHKCSVTESMNDRSASPLFTASVQVQSQNASSKAAIDIALNLSTLDAISEVAESSKIDSNEVEPNSFETDCISQVAPITLMAVKSDNVCTETVTRNLEYESKNQLKKSHVGESPVLDRIVSQNSPDNDENIPSQFLANQRVRCNEKSAKIEGDSKGNSNKIASKRRSTNSSSEKQKLCSAWKKYGAQNSSLEPEKQNLSHEEEDAKSEENTSKSEVVNKNGNHNCTHCPYSSDKKSRLARHVNKHIVEAEHKCTFCSYNCRSSEILVQHLRLHGEAVEITDATIADANELLNPIQGSIQSIQKSKIVKEVRYRSEVIGYKVKLKKKMVFRCKFCPHQVDIIAFLNLHYDWNHDAESISKRNKMATSVKLQSSLSSKHQQLSDRLYKCDLCPFVSSIYSQMYRHKKKHSETSRYACDVCSYSVASLYSLEMHKNVHRNSEHSDISAQPDVDRAETSASCQSENSSNTSKSSASCEDHDIFKQLGFKPNTLVSNSQLPPPPHSLPFLRQDELCCSKCPFVSVSVQLLNLHLNLHENKRRLFACHVCSFNCHRAINLFDHLKLHFYDSRGSRLSTLHRTRHQSAALSRDPVKLFLAHFNDDGNCKDGMLQCRVCSYRSAAHKQFYEHQFTHAKAIQKRLINRIKREGNGKSDEPILPKLKLSLPKISSDKKQVCTFCTFSCDSLSAFHSHYDRHVRKGIFSCHFCNYSDNTFNVVKFHEDNHHQRQSLLSFMKLAISEPGIVKIDVSDSLINNHITDDSGVRISCNLCEFETSKPSAFSLHWSKEHHKKGDALSDIQDQEYRMHIFKPDADIIQFHNRFQTSGDGNSETP